MSNKDCLVIVPAYNEAQNIKKVLKDLINYFVNILIIDDGSNDGGTTILNNFEKIDLICIQSNRGKGYAIREGLKRAINEKVKSDMTDEFISYYGKNILRESVLINGTKDFLNGNKDYGMKEHEYLKFNLCFIFNSNSEDKLNEPLSFDPNLHQHQFFLQLKLNYHGLFQNQIYHHIYF